MPNVAKKEICASPACAPGLEATQGPNARPPVYTTVFFGGTREYLNDEDGWTVVSHKKKRKSRAWRDLRED
jgi:hypothetical protein